MSKFLFTPFSIAGGLLAAAIGTKIFERIWARFDDAEPPDPKHRDASWKKVVPALLLQGAIFRAVRGVVDRASRKGFERATGTWPGDARPEAG